MTRGIAIDDSLRSVIIRLKETGPSNTKIGKLLDISRYSVGNIVRLHKSSGSIALKPRYLGKSHITDINRRALKRTIQQNRRANYGQLSLLWSEAIGKHVSRSTCHREAKKLGFGTYKVIFLS